VGEACTLLGLWLVQLATKLPMFEVVHTEARITVGCVYLVLAIVLVVRQRRAWRPLMRDGFRTAPAELVSVVE
jgi:hypothetical protein